MTFSKSGAAMASTGGCRTAFSLKRPDTEGDPDYGRQSDQEQEYCDDHRVVRTIHFRMSYQATFEQLLPALAASAPILPITQYLEAEQHDPENEEREPEPSGRMRWK